VAGLREDGDVLVVYGLALCARLRGEHLRGGGAYHLITTFQKWIAAGTVDRPGRYRALFDRRQGRGQVVRAREHGVDDGVADRGRVRERAGAIKQDCGRTRITRARQRGDDRPLQRDRRIGPEQLNELWSELLEGPASCEFYGADPYLN